MDSDFTRALREAGFEVHTRMVAQPAANLPPWEDVEDASEEVNEFLAKCKPLYKVARRAAADGKLSVFEIFSIGYAFLKLVLATVPKKAQRELADKAGDAVKGLLEDRGEGKKDERTDERTDANPTLVPAPTRRGSGSRRSFLPKKDEEEGKGKRKRDRRKKPAEAEDKAEDDRPLVQPASTVTPREDNEVPATGAEPAPETSTTETSTSETVAKTEE